jgi:predicted RNA-binding Zn-ribbon protein involved in translation (DUF1610 family)
MIYKVWIQIEEIDEDKNHYLNISEPYEAAKFDTEADAVKFVEDELMITRIPVSAIGLLEACKSITSYTVDLLYRLDNQVDLDDIEEIQQAKAAIARYGASGTPDTNIKKLCQAGFKFLDSLPETGLTTQLENRQGYRKILNDALNQNVFVVDDRCPKCGAEHGERQFKERSFLDVEAIHVHYTCNKCGSEIIEEFTLSDVFIDNPKS